MANQSRRGHLVRSATSRSRTDASPDWAKGADFNQENSAGALSALKPLAAQDGGADRDDASFVPVASDPAHQAYTQGKQLLSPSVCDRVETDGDGDFRQASPGQGEHAEAGLSHFPSDQADRTDLQRSIAEFSGANLSGGMFDHANFAKTDLANANLKGASLRFAVLAEADLTGANLSGADLRYARLKLANLAGANLSGAFLDYADFSGANLGNTNLCSAHLRYAKNLTPAQFEDARISVATVLPLHYLEPGLKPQAKSHARTRKRPLRAASVAALGLISALLPLLLVWQPLPPSGQTAKVAAPAIASVPTLASSTPEMVAAEAAIEGQDKTRRTGQQSLVAVSVSAMALARNSTTTTLAIPPIVSHSVPAQGLRLADAAAILVPPQPETVAAAPSARLSLTAAGPSDLLADIAPPRIRALAVAIVLPVRENVGTPSATPARMAVDPLLLVVSLSQQKLDVYRGTALVTSSKVSSGKPGYDTRTGVFSIIEKERLHHSNLFSAAPMPWMQRITWSGTALHAGVVPGYPASHGCVRLPFSFAPKLFQMTDVGENVVVAYNHVVPKLIEHSKLFQPTAGARPIALAAAAETASVAPKIPVPPQDVASENPVEDATTDADAVADDASEAPLRILITRRTERDRIIAVQYLLASLGYLEPQNFTGRLGAETIAAIKAFQTANGLQETGAFSDDLAKAVYRVAGKTEPPEGHLFVRQEYRSVFDIPVAFRDPQKTLGTHVFTAMKFSPGDVKIPWLVVSLEGDDSVAVLDRIEIPDEVRQEISTRLTPGSSLIIADASVNSSLLRKGDDFIVLSDDAPKAAAVDVHQTPAARPTDSTQSRAQSKAKKAKTDQTRSVTAQKFYPPAEPARRRFPTSPLYGGFWSFRQ